VGNLKGKTCAAIAQSGTELKPLADYGTKGSFIGRNFYASFFFCQPIIFFDETRKSGEVDPRWPECQPEYTDNMTMKTV
jgi:hypothetical protein